MTYPPGRVIENLDNLCLLVLRSKLSTLKHSTLLLNRKKVYHTNTTFPLIPMRFHSLAVCFTACYLCSFAFLMALSNSSLVIFAISYPFNLLLRGQIYAYFTEKHTDTYEKFPVSQPCQSTYKPSSLYSRAKPSLS